MKMTQIIKNRIDEIGTEVMKLVENMQMSLTEKNKLMKPLVEEKKVLQKTLFQLQEIEQRDYSGRCSDKS